MTFLFDRMLAGLVGMTVLLILVALTTSRTATTYDATRYHAAKQMQRNLVEMLERDVLNLGTGVPVGSPMVLANEADRFAFRAAVNGSGVARLIEYRRIPVSGDPAGEDSLFRIERWVDGEITGGTSGLVTHFSVALQDSTGADVGSAFIDARRVAVRTELAVPLEGGASTVASSADASVPVRRMAWETVFEPSNLRRGGLDAYSVTYGF